MGKITFEGCCVMREREGLVILVILVILVVLVILVIFVKLVILVTLKQHYGENIF